MENDNTIPAKEFCLHYGISYELISSLSEAGLVEIITVEAIDRLHLEQLPQIEKLVRLHNELEINAPGIETIIHLLERIKQMKHDMRILKRRLSLYEPQ